MKPLQAPQLPQASGAVPVGGGRPRSAIAGPRELSAAEGLGPGGAPSEPSTQRRHGTWRRTHPANPTLGGIGRGQPRPMAERGTRSPHPANPRSGTRQPPCRPVQSATGTAFTSVGVGALQHQLRRKALRSAQSALSLRSSRGRTVRGRALARARSSRGRAPLRPPLPGLGCCRPPFSGRALLLPRSSGPSAPRRPGGAGRAVAGELR